MSQSFKVSNPNVFRTATLFFDKWKISKIAAELGLSREAVYPLLARARDEGYVRLVPPRAETISVEIEKKFGISRDDFRVVDVADSASGDLVAAEAADIVLDLIKEVARSRGDRVRTADGKTTPRVGLGLSSGRATLDFSRHLGDRLHSEANVPKLKVFALSAGCPAREPEFAAGSFFSLLPRDVAPDFVGLFAETLVPARIFKDIRKRPGVREAFGEKEEIDIVVTSMGDLEDPDDLFRTFLQNADEAVSQFETPHAERPPGYLASLRAKGAVGSVAYLPYSKRGPVMQDGNDLRAVTLFEIHELVHRAQLKNKHMVLIGRRCGKCGRDRSDVLRPLLTVPELKVWTKLVMDVTTARGLLNEPS